MVSFLSRWWLSWNREQNTKSKKKRRNNVSRRPPRYRPSVECLECRDMPSVSRSASTPPAPPPAARRRPCPACHRPAPWAIRPWKGRRGKSSSNGRYVVFISNAVDLGGGNASQTKVPPAYGPSIEVYRRDTLTGVTQEVSSGCVDGATNASISADGQTVAYISSDDLGLPGESTQNQGDYYIYLANMTTGTTTFAGYGIGGGATAPLVSPNGNYVAFQSTDPNPLAPPPPRVITPPPVWIGSQPDHGHRHAGRLRRQCPRHPYSLALQRQQPDAVLRFQREQRHRRLSQRLEQLRRLCVQHRHRHEHPGERERRRHRYRQWQQLRPFGQRGRQRGRLLQRRHQPGSVRPAVGRGEHLPAQPVGGNDHHGQHQRLGLRRHRGSISANGQYVAFQTGAGLTGPNTAGIYRYNVSTGALQLVTVQPNGAPSAFANQSELTGNEEPGVRLWPASVPVGERPVRRLRLHRHGPGRRDDEHLSKRAGLHLRARHGCGSHLPGELRSPARRHGPDQRAVRYCAGHQPRWRGRRLRVRCLQSHDLAR